MSHIQITNGEVIVDERAQVPSEASRFLNQHGGDSWINHQPRKDPPFDESTFVPPLRNLYVTTSRVGFGVGRKAYFPNLKTEGGKTVTDYDSPKFYAEHNVQYEWAARVFDLSIRL